MIAFIPREPCSGVPRRAGTEVAHPESQSEQGEIAIFEILDRHPGLHRPGSLDTIHVSGRGQGMFGTCVA